MSISKASDAVEYLLYKTELELNQLDDFSLQFPDQGKGLAFWIGLRDSCNRLAEKYPGLLESICDGYERIWNRWKDRITAWE